MAEERAGFGDSVKRGFATGVGTILAYGAALLLLRWLGRPDAVPADDAEPADPAQTVAGSGYSASCSSWSTARESSAPQRSQTAQGPTTSPNPSGTGSSGPEPWPEPEPWPYAPSTSPALRPIAGAVITEDRSKKVFI